MGGFDGPAYPCGRRRQRRARRDRRNIARPWLAALGVNGGVAMRAILAPGGPPINAVVLDSLMPGEPSFALARVAKMLRLPVVMISGSHECMTFAADHELQLLPKPFHAAELIQAIESAFASGEFGQRHTPLQQ